jgi:hypothetical protein
MRQDNSCRNFLRSLLSQCRLNSCIYRSFKFCFCKRLFMYVAQASLSSSLKPRSSVVCTEHCVVLLSNIFDKAFSQVGRFLFLFTFLLLFGSDFESSCSIANKLKTEKWAVSPAYKQGRIEEFVSTI